MTGTGPSRTDCESFILAAGGVVWRDGAKREVAVIYRDRHVRNECCLPKGKLDTGEDWVQAALREVAEETGCDARILGFCDVLLYYVRGWPKIVVYFEMVALREGAFRPSEEVRDMAWLAPAAAVRAMTHEGERSVLRRVASRSDPFDPADGRSAGAQTAR